MANSNERNVELEELEYESYSSCYEANPFILCSHLGLAEPNGEGMCVWCDTQHKKWACTAAGDLYNVYKSCGFSERAAVLLALAGVDPKECPVE